MTQPEKFPYEQPLREGMEKIVTEMLGWPKPADHIAEMYDQVIEYLNGLLDTLQREQPPPRDIACRAGCAFCCHWYEVNLTPLEALRLGDYITDNFDDEDRAALVERAKETEAKKQDHPPDGPRPIFACPLLVDGQCSVYEARPLLCRGFNSFDAEVCEQYIVDKPEPVDGATSPIEGYVHPQTVMSNASQGFRLGLKRAGLSSDLLDLTPALRIVLTEADAAQRWLAGEPVFRPARSRLSEYRGELEN